MIKKRLSLGILSNDYHLKRPWRSGIGLGRCFKISDIYLIFSGFKCCTVMVSVSCFIDLKI